jgi:hypothetical protein
MTAAWLLLDQLQLDKGLSKVLLGTVGVLVNPLVFRFRDKVALKDCAVSKPEEMLTPLPKIDVTRAPRVL